MCLWELLITDIKSHELNMESDVYAPLRAPNTPCQTYRHITGLITKYNDHGGDLLTGECKFGTMSVTDP